MAFDIGDRVRIADYNSQWIDARMRGPFPTGEVQDIVDIGEETFYQVRINGHGCHRPQSFLAKQLQPETSASPLEYDRC